MERAEKVLSIVGSLAGVAGAATGMVALLRIRTASAAPPQGDLPPGSMQSGRDIHIGHKVNAGGVLAVGGILAALYLVLGATGVVRSTAPDAGIANLTVPRLREDGAKVGADAGVLAQPAGRRHSLRLSTPTVRIGDTYVATVTGLAPGERVFLYWTGPSNGTIAVLAGDSEGRARASVREGAEPGNYLIKADAERSGQTAEAPLRVTSGG